MLGLCYCTRAFSSCSEKGLLSSCGAHRLVIVVTSLVAGHRLGVLVAHGLRSVASRFQSMSSVVVAANLLALWHVGSFWTRDPTCVLLIGKQIRNHWAIREAPKDSFYIRKTYLQSKANICLPNIFFFFSSACDFSSSLVKPQTPYSLLLSSGR